MERQWNRSYSPDSEALEWAGKGYLSLKSMPGVPSLPFAFSVEALLASLVPVGLESANRESYSLQPQSRRE